MIANSLMGGVAVAAIVHPVNFVYGALGGLILGGFIDGAKERNYPRGFELKFKPLDEENRKRLLRED